MTPIFVHGAAMDGRMWQRHLAAIDGPGVAVTLGHFGAAPDTSRPLTLATHAEEVVSAAARCTGVVLLVGWSFGCMPVLEAALQLGEKVVGVVIYEPGAPELVLEEDRAAFSADAEAFYAPVGELVPRGELHEAARRMVEQSGGDGVMGELDPAFGGILSDNAHTMAALFAAGPQAVEPARYGAIGCPVTVAWGSDTRAVFALPSKGAAQRFGGRGSGPVEGADHLWPLRDPEGFAAFVVSRPGSGAR